jgi:hypothetical protein
VKPLFRPVATKKIFEKIKDQLKNCRQNHRDCNFQDLPILPHRVLDVGPNNPSEIIKLHISKQGERQPYAVLSYCWGGRQDFLMTTKTIESFIRGFLLEALPGTIRDAVIVTRSLDIRYLWVDAFCIIQDSSIDKSAEIASMGEIYRNASITVAAGSASSSKDGFLEDRSIYNRSKVCRVPLFLSQDLWGSMWVGNDPSDLTTNKEHLETRAWALQESLLSPRLLFYGSKEIIWKCQTDVHKALQRDGAYSYSEDAGRLPSNVFEPSFKERVITISSQGKLWRRIIQNYSHRNLTLSEDRLPALGGVASELGKVWHDTYIVGMWRRCLIRHLGWKQIRDNKITPATENAAYRSPGWSWVTWPGPIEISETYVDDAEVIDYTITLADDRHPFGNVISGTLVLRAFLIQAPQCDRNISYTMDIGPSGKRSLNSDSRLLLLGYTTRWSSIALVVTHQDNEQYIRIGQAQVAKKSDLWLTEDSERQVVTLI